VAVRAHQLRAVLIPAGAALISIGALAWYAMYRIPDKQRYLDERNIRLLRTIGAQIKVKVNYFDQAIDNAIESFDHTDTVALAKDLPAYVKLFAPDLEIVDTTTIGDPKLEFTDPPRVKIVLDEGRHYLYLAYSHGVRMIGGEKVQNQVLARAVIEAAVGAYLSSHPEFDAIALLDNTGRAIVQQSATGVEIPRLDPTGAPATKGQKRDSAGGIENVRIGGADYRFYVQPVQLSLHRETGDDPEEWKLCGLVRADHFRSASAEISSTYWLLLLAALTALLLAIPIVKLHVVHPRERYHAYDGVATAVSSFLLASLLTFVLLDAFYFGYRSDRDRDARLAKLARDLNTSFANEVNAASDELDLQQKALDSALKLGADSDTARRRIQRFNKNTVDCVHALVCRTDVLLSAAAVGKGRYPYYRIMTWSDSAGRQRYKWTTSRKITPFINISALPYVDDARRARRLLSYDSTVAQRGVSVIRSPNTGEALTVIWRALEVDSSRQQSLRTASLATSPIAFAQPILTWGVHFAVVNLTGQVLYHSDSARSLNENFFQESMDGGAIRAAVVGRKTESLSAEYFGRRFRMYVQPIAISPERKLADPQWSLIVFERGLIPETVNLEVLTLAVLMFAAYALLLAIAWAVAHSAWPSGTDKWLWPDARKTAGYVGVTAVNAVLGLAFLFVVAHRSPRVLLGVTLAMSLFAIVATFCIVRYARRGTGPEAHFRFHWWFLMARVSFLFIVGVVPAMAAFRVAERYENGLLLGRRAMHVRSEVRARIDRIVKQQNSLRVCDKGATCAEANAFLQQRLGTLPYEVSIAAADTGRVSSDTLRLASTLALGHAAYNNVSVDLRAAMPRGPTDSAQFHLEYPVLGAVLALLIVLVIRKLVWPLYVLDLYRSPGFATSVVGNPSGGASPARPAFPGILVQRVSGNGVSVGGDV
jgi:hypothetical protein